MAQRRAADKRLLHAAQNHTRTPHRVHLHTQASQGNRKADLAQLSHGRPVHRVGQHGPHAAPDWVRGDRTRGRRRRR
ncbi:hypothetical protein, partial [Mycobacterium senriense]|uniref:hypothetical protein n=1 Tax=Mycobacterium senriense TaxID=2775496 RepID=UPI0039EFCA1C